ncbi:hypothetical protein [Oryzibacter oryziterrae]|nr:hypothetical protein [Oryzibacter oryziterrae]
MQLLITAGIGIYLLGKASAADVPHPVGPELPDFPAAIASR